MIQPPMPNPRITLRPETYEAIAVGAFRELVVAKAELLLARKRIAELEAGPLGEHKASVLDTESSLYVKAMEGACGIQDRA